MTESVEEIRRKRLARLEESQITNNVGGSGTQSGSGLRQSETSVRQSETSGINSDEEDDIQRAIRLSLQH